RVLAVGGDGTLHEVLNGLLQNQESPGEAGPSLGVIPLGTGRDYHRTFRFGRTPEEMTHAALSPHTCPVDVGELWVRDAYGRPVRTFFANVAGFGFDASVAHRANVQYARRRSPGVYLRCIFQELSNLQNLQIVGNLDGRDVEIRSALFVMAIARYFGGRFFVAPHASPVDGWADVLWVEGLTPWRLVRLLPTLYRGKHLSLESVHTRRVRSLHLTSVPRVPVEADGEVVGYTPVEMRIRSRVLALAVPEERCSALTGDEPPSS
ncbi:MAG: hypothetical protein L3J76_02105, partial [Candidatus Hydrothermae bacterium]|nr:hypothetical protein [Candidatus Hydrothermae bacterium]